MIHFYCLESLFKRFQVYFQSWKVRSKDSQFSFDTFCLKKSCLTQCLVLCTLLPLTPFSLYQQWNMTKVLSPKVTRMRNVFKIRAFDSDVSVSCFHLSNISLIYCLIRDSFATGAHLRNKKYVVKHLFCSSFIPTTFVISSFSHYLPIYLDFNRNCNTLPK